KIVDTQQQQSNFQRVREDSFNLSEGMLYQESQILSRRWPASATTAFPASCTQINYSTAAPPVGNSDFCTDPTTVTTAGGGGLFSGADFSGTANVQWDVQVRDNGDSNGGIQQNYDKNTADGVTAAGVANPQRKCST